MARLPRDRTVIRLPSYEQVRSDAVLYAHANRVLHLETNPGNARALVQAHGEGTTARDVWINPPPIPLTTAEMDYVFDLPYARGPHPAYADEHGRHDGATKIPAWEMIRFSVNIMRGCFGGCTFCSITSMKAESSRAARKIRSSGKSRRCATRWWVSPAWSATSAVPPPTCPPGLPQPGDRSRLSQAQLRLPRHLPEPHHQPRPADQDLPRARALKGIKKILIGSGLRYDLAVKSPEYVKELVQHHVGGYLKIAPEHTESGPLSKMMKPGIGSYDRFKALFEKYSEEAGKSSSSFRTSSPRTRAPATKT